MSSDSDEQSKPVESITDLIAVIRRGEKPISEFRVGTEHEKAPFFQHNFMPVDYAGGIKPMLLALAERGFTPLPDQHAPIALTRGNASISLEPGGQFELSGAPLATIHETADELRLHLDEAKAVAAPLNIAFSTLAFQPRQATAVMPWMPKERYRIMRDYLPTRGYRAHEMMLLSSTVQANFDFSSEADMAAKMRCAMAVSPVVAALFANSPYAYGEWSGHRSRRYAMWRDVDPDRCGLLPFVFEEGFSYRDYVEWALDVPMFFVRRQGAYIPARGLTFRSFWRDGFNGERAMVADFENHLSTLFPEVRLKSFIEVRSADVGEPAMILALPALWKGILYDAEALRDAYQLTRAWSFSQRLFVQYVAAQEALWGRGAFFDLWELARELVRISEGGLKRQARRNDKEEDESIYLAPLWQRLQMRRTSADLLVQRYGAGPLEGENLSALLLDTVF